MLPVCNMCTPYTRYDWLDSYECNVCVCVCETVIIESFVDAFQAYVHNMYSYIQYTHYIEEGQHHRISKWGFVRTYSVVFHLAIPIPKKQHSNTHSINDGYIYKQSVVCCAVEEKHTHFSHVKGTTPVIIALQKHRTHVVNKHKCGVYT